MAAPMAGTLNKMQVIDFGDLCKPSHWMKGAKK